MLTGDRGDAPEATDPVLRDDPVLRGCRSYRLLTGLSGALVYLVADDAGLWWVRKAAATPANNERLVLQAAKQAKFSLDEGSPLRAPRVLDEGEAEGRFYFDMEYVRGIDGAAFLRLASLGEVQGFADRLCEFQTWAASTSSEDHLVDPFAALFTKVCDVQRQTGAVPDRAMARLMLLLDGARRIGPRPSTACHGDLTLENLVVAPDGVVWAVDLLDSPIEHYWQDVAKLHQDLAGGWYRRREAAISRAVLTYVSRRIRSHAEGLDPAYRAIHSTLIACTFVRILPYVTDEDDRTFVQQRVEHFVQAAEEEQK